MVQILVLSEIDYLKFFQFFFSRSQWQATGGQPYYFFLHRNDGETKKTKVKITFTVVPANQSETVYLQDTDRWTKIKNM